MIHITNTKLCVGLEKPVKLLHITDIHLTYANENDIPYHQKLMKKRLILSKRRLSARFLSQLRGLTVMKSPNFIIFTVGPPVRSSFMIRL